MLSTWMHIAGAQYGYARHCTERAESKVDAPLHAMQAQRNA